MKTIYTTVLALAFVTGGVPFIAFANESTSTLEANRDNLQVQNRIQMGNSSTSVRSNVELNAQIEWRKQELDKDDADTIREDRDIMVRTNPVRVAVHTFLDSKELFGGIGPRVSEIAREMNDSVATTTDVETKMRSRGFFIRFFFGGDKNAAEIISQEVTRNQRLIAELTTLLVQASISSDMRATLIVQITAINEAQVRLMALAQKERNGWGLFSWRLGT